MVWIAKIVFAHGEWQKTLCNGEGSLVNTNYNYQEKGRTTPAFNKASELVSV